MSHEFSTSVYVCGKLFAFICFKRIPILIDLRTKEIIILDDLQNYDPSFIADQMVCDEGNVFVLELNGNRLMDLSVSIEIMCLHLNRIERKDSRAVWKWLTRINFL